MPFLPEFKHLVASIEMLLMGRGTVMWTEQCTTLLNQLLELIYGRLRLCLPDPTQPFTLHPDFDNTHMVAVLT